MDTPGVKSCLTLELAKPLGSTQIDINSLYIPMSTIRRYIVMFELHYVALTLKNLRTKYTHVYVCVCVGVSG